MSTDTTLINYDLPNAAIGQLAELYKNIECNGPDGYASVKDARNVMRDHRLGIEESRVEKKSGILAAGKAIDAEAKRIQELIKPIETQLNDKLKVVDDKKKADKEAAAAVIQKRLDAIKEEIQDNLCVDQVNFMDYDIDLMDECLTVLEGQEISLELYREYIEEARLQKYDTIEFVIACMAQKEKDIEQERITKEAADAVEKQRLANEAKAKELADKEKLIDEASERLQAARDKETEAAQQAAPETVQHAPTPKLRVRIYTIQLDGNSWCATNEKFINLQESCAGFGDSAIDALQALQDIE